MYTVPTASVSAVYRINRVSVTITSGENITGRRSQSTVVCHYFNTVSGDEYHKIPWNFFLEHG